MPIENGFILAAGYGTRMGEIGKVLPKVLWPVFESTLLGLQINFLKSLGINNVAVNLHHQYKQIKSYLDKNFANITQLHEEDILDSGGGVHNYILKNNIKEKFVCLNSDQYLDVDIKNLKEKLEVDSSIRSRLFTSYASGDYSSLVSNDLCYLVDIKNQEGSNMFVGLSVINPKGLKLELVKSKYFESVSNYKTEKVEVCDLDGKYLDFGEVKKYHKSCFQVLKNVMASSEGYQLWRDQSLIDLSKINTKLNSYNCTQPEVLNFSQAPLKCKYSPGSIILQESTSLEKIDFPVIIYQDKKIKIT